MKRLVRYGKTLLPLMLLVGCAEQPQVAYWTDASYKSSMDYDALQKFELKEELKGISSNLSNLVLDGKLEYLTKTEDLEDTENSTGSQENDVIRISKDNVVGLVAYMRSDLSRFFPDKHSDRWYMHISNDAPQMVGLPSEYIRVVKNTQYVNIRTLAMLPTSTLSHEDFITNTSNFIETILFRTQANLEDVELPLSSLIGAVDFAMTNTTVSGTDLK